MGTEVEAEVVLVVEDSPANSRILCHIIKRLGFEVVEAGNGNIALQIIKDMPKERKLVGIFSDIMMPDMDGMTLLEQVRQIPEVANIFFVFVTAVFESESVLKAKNLKVNGYLLKPVTTEKVSKALTSMMRYASQG